MKLKYYIFLIIIIIFFALLFTINGGKSKHTDQEDANSPVKITYWCDSNPISIDVAHKLVEKWHNIQNEIRVKVVPIPASHSSEETLLTAIAAGTTPDISENIWAGGIKTYAGAGALIKLNEFPDFNKYKNRRIPEDMAEGTKYKGDYYAIPYRTNPIMMLYNTAMFEEAGVKPPLRTYDEFYKAADAITKDTDNDGQLDQWMGFAQQKPVWWYRLMDFYCFYIAASEGQRLMENGEIIFNNKTAVEVMEFYQTIFENNYYPKTFFQVEPFTAGKIATVPTGPWHLRYLEKHAPDNLSYDVMSLPVPNEPNGPVHTYTSTHCLGIFSNTEHPRAVWKFVKFITSVQSELTMLKSSRQLPARKNLLEIPTFKDFFNSHPLMVKFAKQLPYCPRMDTNENFKEILDEISQQFEACAIYGRKSPEQAIDDAAERAKVIIEWNKSR